VRFKKPLEGPYVLKKVKRLSKRSFGLFFIALTFAQRWGERNSELPDVHSRTENEETPLGTLTRPC
jgi:hypothetical protein